MTRFSCTAACLLCFVLGAERADAARITLDQAVTAAIASHPRVVAARARLDVARAQVDEARLNELPAVGVSGQINRSTPNSVPGSFYATPLMPSVSGTAKERTLTNDTWESGAAIWGDIDVTGFVQKLAIADAAVANRTGAGAALRGRELQTAFDVANEFLLVLAAEAQVVAARASVERARTFARVVQSLVDQTLRPGADAARVDADVALAESQLARAEQLAAIRRAELAEAIGSPDDSLDADPGGLLRPVDDFVPPIAGDASNPFLQERAAAVARAKALSRATRLDSLPHLDLVGSLWARGAGIFPGGLDLGSMTGVIPDTPNWAVGVVVSWNLLGLPAIAARSRAADARTDEEIARRNEVALAIRGETARARAMLEGAKRVARTTPVALASARTAEAAAEARYRAALVSVLDVADAQRVLAQAEIEDALARLDVRRAVLYLARAAGDLAPFFDDARRRAP